MRARSLLLLLALLSACRARSSSIEGSVADGSGITEVWPVGDAEGSPVRDGTFRLDHLRGDTLRLRFLTRDDTARMELTELPRGARLRLDRVWVADGVAFPGRLDAGGARRVRVNGLWMGGEAALRGSLTAIGSVLALSGEADALLLRPSTGELPDLRVVITPGTVATTEDGDPLPPRELAVGDTLRVEGESRDGYLVATRITGQRRREP
jgi:hypothetical protein